jgi:O-antigen/teichoic acid export membrane protein
VSRSRLAIWNYLSALLFTAITLLGLVVTKYLVALLGDDRFGAARMVRDWLGYLTIFEIGLGSTLAPLIARALAHDDKSNLEATVSAGLRSFAGLLGLILLIATAMLAGITWLIPTAATADLRLAWCVGVIGLTPMVLSPFRALADARQHGYRINLALAGQSLLIFALSLLFARSGWGITGQIAATSIATVSLALFLTRDGLRSFPGLFRAAVRSRPDPGVWRSIVGLGVPTFLIALSGRISVLTDSLIVGKILAPRIAGYLVITQSLTNLAQSQLQGIGNACWAALAQLHAQGRTNDFNRRLVELTGLVSLLGIAALGPIVAYSRHFVALWIDEAHYLGDDLVLVAAVNAFLLGLFSLWSWCFSGTGQVRRMVPITVIGAVVNLTASIILTMEIGPKGPLLGTMLGFVGLSLWYLPLALRKVFGTSIRSLFVAAARPLMWGFPYSALLYAWARGHTPRGWIGLAFEMGVAALVFLGLAYRAVLAPEDRDAWTNRIRGAIRRS